MGRLIFSISLVVFGIFTGYLFQILVKKKQWDLPYEAIRRALQKTALLFLNPVAIVGATWVAHIDDIKIAAMPFMGMTALFTGGILAFGFSKLLKLNRPQTGSFIVCGGFTNIGSLGALFCFLFLGEAGFALVPFYKLFEESIYYAIGFPIAKSYGDVDAENLTFWGRVKSAVTDLFVVVAVCSIITGLCLNLLDIPRPVVYASVNTVIIPLAALLLLISIGMAMRFSAIGRYLKPGLLIAAFKAFFIPAIVFLLGWKLGLGEIDNGLPLKVVLILSSMPVGFIAMVPPTIYRLDIDLSNACWLITNAMVILQVPILLWLVQSFL
ncbi:MAG: hypothetical protein D3926_02910 [Desulfobacteraceae bacterium]|nr:MAG: hypothetical protein D3926_02910 [Desulfobacteraceae bacterium]